MWTWLGYRYNVEKGHKSTTPLRIPRLSNMFKVIALGAEGLICFALQLLSSCCEATVADNTFQIRRSSLL